VELELLRDWDEKVKFALRWSDDGYAASEFLKEDYPLIRSKLEDLIKDNIELQRIVSEYISDGY
jgi:hypothetical protein